ncbi:hypothetical protein K502DRAFT_352153 [Neoconidiobolus thromboides FSU 785]|nr:hypothetical protein K502DRAFT_352153 [Neoconidiobolus thromboides FSU 785]
MITKLPYLMLETVMDLLPIDDKLNSALLYKEWYLLILNKILYKLEIKGIKQYQLWINVIKSKGHLIKHIKMEQVNECHIKQVLKYCTKLRKLEIDISNLRIEKEFNIEIQHIKSFKLSSNRLKSQLFLFNSLNCLHLDLPLFQSDSMLNLLTKVKQLNSLSIRLFQFEQPLLTYCFNLNVKVLNLNGKLNNQMNTVTVDNNTIRKLYLNFNHNNKLVYYINTNQLHTLELINDNNQLLHQFKLVKNSVLTHLTLKNIKLTKKQYSQFPNLKKLNFGNDNNSNYKHFWYLCSKLRLISLTINDPKLNDNTFTHFKCIASLQQFCLISPLYLNVNFWLSINFKLRQLTRLIVHNKSTTIVDQVPKFPLKNSILFLYLQDKHINLKLFPNLIHAYLL